MSIFDIFNIKNIKEDAERLKIRVSYLEKELRDTGYYEHQNLQNKINAINTNIVTNNNMLSKLNEEIYRLSEQNETLIKQINTSVKKLSRTKELYKSVEYAITNFFNYDVGFEKCKIPSLQAGEIDEYTPTIMLKLHCMDMKDLRKAYNDNDKQIQGLLEQYASRYTTKANKSIYQLLVIALRAEQQNILYNLKYEKIDNAIQSVKTTITKYLAIAGEGNQSIAGTLTKFIGEIEYLFINAVKIEYNYYVKHEQAKQEQMAIREQLRQEAEERKALEDEKKKVEAEEKKYISEIERINELLSSAAENEIEKYNRRLLELEAQLASVIVKKEEITNLQNGKAGTIYIISNLGSFGDGMFKIGMTRRIDPQDRVNELGDASVPFRFDIHSLIFSDDAVSLESRIHEKLSNSRVNKVNLRREFFYSSIDDLEALVLCLEPTAEFNVTMVAEEYRQSLSTKENYVSDYAVVGDDE